jgi:hypothetical protein
LALPAVFSFPRVGALRAAADKARGSFGRLDKSGSAVRFSLAARHHDQLVAKAGPDLLRVQRLDKGPVLPQLGHAMSGGLLAQFIIEE